MHELSIALSIVEGVEEELARQGGGSVSAVHLKLGKLSGVVKDALLFAYEVASEGTPLQGSKLMIRDVPVRIYCSSCRAEHESESIQDLRCPDCPASIPEILQGRELEVTALELPE